MPNLILDLIKNKPIEEVKQFMNEKAVSVSWNDNLYIFNYGAAPDFSDPYVCEARGIIINVDKKEVVCRGYDKFFNFSEPYAADIDWASARVQEKVDGSIIKAYYYNGEWRFATNAVINADTCQVPQINANIGGIYRTFGELIRAAENYKDIPFDKLDKGSTYIFELTSPYNHVVVHYDKILLFHTGTRDNKTGQERVEDIGIIKPKQYPLRSMDECIEAVKKLNKEGEQVDQEGFVVVDKDYNRIKVKAPEYLLFHSMANNHVLTKERVLDMVESDDFDEKLFLEQFPEFEDVFNWYEYEIDHFRRECKNHIVVTREMARIQKLTPKEIYAIYKDDPYCFVAMSAVNRQDLTAKQIINYVRESKKRALIHDYIPDWREKLSKEEIASRDNFTKRKVEKIEKFMHQKEDKNTNVGYEK